VTEINGKGYGPPQSGPIDRTMMRCRSCSRWQSFGPGDALACGNCGSGELAVVDWDAHHKTLPRAPYDPSKDPKVKK
jgi:hypothetical protein